MTILASERLLIRASSATKRGEQKYLPPSNVTMAHSGARFASWIRMDKRRWLRP